MSELVVTQTDDDRCEKMEASDPETLGIGWPVADFSLSSDPQGTLQVMVRLDLVQAKMRPPLNVAIHASRARIPPGVIVIASGKCQFYSLGPDRLPS